jgi:integrase
MSNFLTLFTINVIYLYISLSFDMVEQPKKILDQMRDVLRLKHYSYRTEQPCMDWVYRFIVFYNKRHPKDMGASEIEAFLSYHAVQRKVAASTQNQALSALVFLYRHVLHQDIGGHIDAVRAKQSRYLPTVLTHEEAIAILSKLSGTHQLVSQILYGSGLRLSEALSLRVKDIDLSSVPDCRARWQGWQQSHLSRLQTQARTLD